MHGRKNIKFQNGKSQLRTSVFGSMRQRMKGLGGSKMDKLRDKNRKQQNEE